VLPESHPLSRRKQIPLKALAADPFIMIPRPHGLGIMDLVTAACLEAGFTPRIAQEARELQTVVGLVAAGFGISLMPRTVQKIRHSGVVYVPLVSPRIFIEIAAAHRSSEASPVLATFLGVLRETLRKPVNRP